MKRILLFALLLSGMITRAQFAPGEGKCKAYFKYEVNTQVMSLLPATAFNFYDKSEGNVVAWWWDFGDGSTSQEQYPMHVYNHPLPSETAKISPYRTVNLTILTTDSCKSFYSETINIMGDFNPGPVKSCRAMFKYYQADYDSLKGTVTFQLNNYSEGKSLQYYWDFGNGQTSNEIEPKVTFDIKPAIHQVCLTVIGDNDCKDIFCDILYFNDPNIVIPEQKECYTGFGYKTNYVIKTFAPALVLDFYSKASPEAVSWKWDFGDGSNSEEQNPTHTFAFPLSSDSLYAKSNPYKNVCLTVTSASGCVAKYCETIYIYMNTTPPVDPAQQCHAWFKYQKAEDIISIPEVIPYKFKDVSDGEVVSRLWKFEDGTTSTDAEPMAYFDFMKSSQKVCLTITTADNCKSTWCETVYLNNFVPDTNYVDKPFWNYTMRYESFFPIQMSSCAGWAKAQVYLKDSIIDAYNYVWSTGDIGQEAKGLCPTRSYTVKAMTPDGTIVSGNFILNADGSVTETPLNWWVTGVRDNPLIQAKPAGSGYTLEWKLCDGTTYIGDSIPLNSINCGSSGSNLFLKDAMGNIVYSESINMKILATYISTMKTSSTWKVYPNPVKDVLNIVYSGDELKEMKIEILDVSGKSLSVQTLRQVEAGQTIGLNVSSLRNGVYLCRMLSGNQLLSVQKFIK